MIKRLILVILFIGIAGFAIPKLTHSNQEQAAGSISLKYENNINGNQPHNTLSKETKGDREVGGTSPIRDKHISD